jgi:HK97 family phage portal protein
MSLFKSLANAIPDTKALPMVTGTRNDAYLAPNINALPSLGTGVTLYPSDTGQTYINKGYKRNAIVFSIVNKCIKKFGQVDWNVVKIVNDERKTAQEYLDLSRKDLSVPAVRELKKMRKKMIDQVPVDNPLSKRLARPNRNQSQAEFLEQLYGYKLLTGEANIWLSRGTENGVPITKGQPLELQAIPKENLLLVKGGDAWDIRGFEIAFGGERIPTPKENIIMWAFFNPSFNPNTLDHLRGMAPLDSAILLLQGSNEGAERLVNMNKNQGAAGFAAREDLATMTPEQSQFMRQQFDTIVHNGHMAGKYAVFGGKWQVHQFGMDVNQLQLLEQLNVHNDWFCNVFDVPPGLFAKDQTYENAKEAKREFIYSNIAPATFSLRDELNDRLLPAYDLDRERFLIDADITNLPELSQDFKTQADAVKNVWSLTPNEIREYLSYDRLEDPNMDKIFIPQGLQPLDDAAMPLGGPLNTDGLD